ncbi:pro-sigmaK processing inhibitor BofA family protein [Bacillaceae bacterium S4-13-58]
MSQTAIISTIIVLVLITLFAGASFKPVKWIANGAVKLAIGALFLFFLNIFGASFGIHVPINIFTSLISGFLGVAGVASLVFIHIFLL